MSIAPALDRALMVPGRDPSTTQTSAQVLAHPKRKKPHSSRMKRQKWGYMSWRAVCGLRQVVPERGEDHSVDTVRLVGSTGPGPGVAHDVGVLRSPLDAALGTTIKAIPEAGGAFDEDARVGRAIAQSAWNKSTRARKSFREATGIVEER